MYSLLVNFNFCLMLYLKIIDAEEINFDFVIACSFHTWQFEYTRTSPKRVKILSTLLLHSLESYLSVN